MRKLNKFSDNCDKLQFGDYILFQEYKDKNSLSEDMFKVTKPIFSIYLGCFVADMALSFNYVEWINDNREEVSDFKSHYEWVDCVDVLGIWKVRPTWQEIISKYRNQEIKDFVSSNDIDW